MIKVHILRCGTVGTDETIPDRSRSKNPLAYTGVLRGERHRVWLPVYAYLIEHPQGRILVDTGWHTDVRADQRKHLSLPINIASKAILPEGEAVTEQLSAMGLSPSEIDIVLLTHLDADHVSGLGLVRDAKKIYADAAELRAAQRGNVRYNRRLWEGISIEPIPMTPSADVPNGAAFDVFGDGTVRFVTLPGHSDGMTGVLVRHGERFVILTGDACYSRRNWEEMKLPGITTDREKAARSIRWVAEMAKQPGCAGIFASHDPESLPRSLEL